METHGHTTVEGKRSGRATVQRDIGEVWMFARVSEGFSCLRLTPAQAEKLGAALIRHAEQARELKRTLAK